MPVPGNYLLARVNSYEPSPRVAFHRTHLGPPSHQLPTKCDFLVRSRPTLLVLIPTGMQRQSAALASCSPLYCPSCRLLPYVGRSDEELAHKFSNKIRTFHINKPPSRRPPPPRPRKQRRKIFRKTATPKAPRELPPTRFWTCLTQSPS